MAAFLFYSILFYSFRQGLGGCAAIHGGRVRAGAVLGRALLHAWSPELGLVLPVPLRTLCSGPCGGHWLAAASPAAAESSRGASGGHDARRGHAALRTGVSKVSQRFDSTKEASFSLRSQWKLLRRIFTFLSPERRSDHTSDVVSSFP